MVFLANKFIRKAEKSQKINATTDASITTQSTKNKNINFLWMK
jgi:hypothetical protein